jgi:predicted oxidoreductase
MEARDREIDNPYSKDAQAMGIRNALSCTGDSLSRPAPPRSTRSWTRAPDR